MQKAFVVIIAVVMLAVLSLIFPIILYLLIAFVVGTLVGGGTSLYVKHIGPFIKRQFAKPEHPPVRKHKRIRKRETR